MKDSTPPSQFEQLESDNSKLRAILLELEKENSELKAENLAQKLTIEELKRKLYGRKSEKLNKSEDSPDISATPNPADPPTEGSTEATVDPCKAEVEQEAVKSVEKRRRYLDRDPLPSQDPEVSEGILPAYLTRKEEEINTKPEDWSEEKYGELKPKITERLVIVPAKVFVKRYIRRVWINRETGKIAPLPPAPSHVLERCSVDESVIIMIIIYHFLFHIPYYRIEKMFDRIRANISRDNMIRWCNNLAFLFAPIVTAIEEEVKQSGTIMIDETPFIGKTKENGKYKRHFYFWPILSPGVGIVFRWTEHRNVETAKEILGNVPSGTTILCDGLNIYKHCQDLYQLNMQLCWAHIRRNFYKALPTNQQLADLALEKIKVIFDAEGALLKAKLPPLELLAKRQSQVKPLIDAFIEWVQGISQLPEVVTDSKLSVACSYLLTRVKEACHFLENPLVLMHNNDNERESKNFKLGAKNWLFCSSKEGADALAVFYSLIRSAQMHRIDPEVYLRDLCKRITQPALKNSDLTPRKWKERFLQEALAQNST
jgi:transposase